MRLFIICLIVLFTPGVSHSLDTFEDYTSTEKTKLAGIEAGAEANEPLVSQTDAEAGTSETEYSWSPLRVAQAIAALASSASNFLGLSDTPSSYSGQGGKVVTVKTDETGLEFTSGNGITEEDPEFNLWLSTTPPIMAEQDPFFTEWLSTFVDSVGPTYSFGTGLSEVDGHVICTVVPYSDSDIDGNESAFTGWDKDASDDFDGAYSSLSGIPLAFTPASHGDSAHSETYLKTEVDGSTTNEIEVQDEDFNATNFNGATATGVSQDDFYDLWHGIDTDDDGDIDVIDSTVWATKQNAGSYLTSEVDGSTTNEINTITGDNATTTSGLAITVVGAGLVSTAVSENTLTITGTGDGTGTDDQTATEVAVNTANFGGHLANDATSDTVQECLDLLDDLTAGFTNLTSFVSQTAWRMFYSNADGDVTELAFGDSGKVLTSNGASAAPTWETPTAGTGRLNYTFTTDDTLSTAEVTNSVVTNQGQASTMTLTLPTPAEGYYFIFTTETAAKTVYIKAAASTYINLNGTDLDDADKVANDGGSSLKGDCIVFITAYDGTEWHWFANSVRGNFTDGGQ